MIQTKQQQIFEFMHSHGYKPKNVAAANVFSESIDDVFEKLGEKTKKLLIKNLKTIETIQYGHPYVYHILTKDAIKRTFEKTASDMICDAIKNSIEKKIGYFGCNIIEDALDMINISEVSIILKRNTENVLFLRTTSKKIQHDLELPRMTIQEISKTKMVELKKIISNFGLILTDNPYCLLKKDV